jgi:hypothetical protein
MQAGSLGSYKLTKEINMRFMMLILVLFSSLTFSDSNQADISALSWLAGNWEMEGFKAHYTTPEGGQIFSISRYFKDGKVTFFELEHFYTKDGVIVVNPYPKGDRSVIFKIANFDPAVKKAVFQNPEHDWPTEISYERTSEDRLFIQVSGPQDGKKRVEKFDLKAAKTP